MKLRSELRVLLLALSMSLTAAPMVAGPATLADIDALIASPAQAASALAAYNGLPPGLRQSADALWVQAQAARAAGKSSAAAEALDTLALLAPTSGKPIAGIRQWLVTQADKLYQAAAGATPAERAMALKAWLNAIKCDPSLLARDDLALREVALPSIKKIMIKQPDRVDLHFQLGFFAYRFGDLAGAAQSFRDHGQATQDPWQKWRSQIWASACQRDLDAQRTSDADIARRAQARTPTPSRSDPTMDDLPTAPEGDAKAAEAEAKRREIDEVIAQVKGNIEDLEAKTTKRKTDTVVKQGKVYFKYHNQRKLGASLEQLRQQLTELEAERAGL